MKKTSKTTKTTKTTKAPKQTVPATLAAEWAGSRLPEPELYCAMKARAMEFGQSASNAGRSAKAAIVLVAKAAAANREAPAPLAAKIATKRARLAAGSAQEPVTRKTPGSKADTYAFQLIETAEFIENQLQQLTPQKAGKINAELERDGSIGRWVPIAAAKAAGVGISLSTATARLKKGDIPGAFSGELPVAGEKPTAVPEVVITESGLELLKRLEQEGKVTVSGNGLGIAVTAGFLSKKALLAIETVGKDRVAQITDAGRAALATAEAAPEKVRKPRLTIDGKTAPQWIAKDLGAGKWLGRNHTHALAQHRIEKFVESTGRKLAWATPFSAFVVGAKKETFEISRVGGGDPAAALKLESAAA